MLQLQPRPDELERRPDELGRRPEKLRARAASVSLSEFLCSNFSVEKFHNKLSFIDLALAIDNVKN